MTHVDTCMQKQPLVVLFFNRIVPFVSKMTGGQKSVIYPVIVGSVLGKIHRLKGSYYNLPTRGLVDKTVFTYFC